MFKRIIAFAISFCLIFEQSGFAQVAGQMQIPGYLANLLPADNFSPVQLRSVIYNPTQESFRLMLDQGDESVRAKQLDTQASVLWNYFLVGLRLPNTMFWVNLRPDAPTNIIDPNLEKTDLGKILLAADLQLKKDMARFTSPDTADGRQYWTKLYAKAEQIYGQADMEIPTITRPWIVPGEVIIKETSTGAYIYKATLNVMLEQDYIKDSPFYNFTDSRQKEMNAYSSELIRNTVLPRLIREINSSKRYAELRQVYYSVVLAQWFKQRLQGQQNALVAKIDSKDLTGLTSTTAWSKDSYYNAYKKSFSQGEYNKEETVNMGSNLVVRNYFSGGADFNIGENIWNTRVIGLIDDKSGLFYDGRLNGKVDPTIAPPDSADQTEPIVEKTQKASFLRNYGLLFSQWGTAADIIEANEFVDDATSFGEWVSWNGEVSRVVQKLKENIGNENIGDFRNFVEKTATIFGILAIGAGVAMVGIPVIAASAGVFSAAIAITFFSVSIPVAAFLGIQYLSASTIKKAMALAGIETTYRNEKDIELRQIGRAASEAAKVYYKDALSRGIDEKTLQAALAEAIQRGANGQKLNAEYTAGDAIREFIVVVGNREHKRWMEANERQRKDHLELFVEFDALAADEQIKDLKGLKQLVDYMVEIKDGGKTIEKRVLVNKNIGNDGYSSWRYIDPNEGSEQMSFLVNVPAALKHHAEIEIDSSVLSWIQEDLAGKISIDRQVFSGDQRLKDAISNFLQEVIDSGFQPIGDNENQALEHARFNTIEIYPAFDETTGKISPDSVFVKARRHGKDGRVDFPTLEIKLRNTRFKIPAKMTIKQILPSRVQNKVISSLTKDGGNTDVIPPRYKREVPDILTGKYAWERSLWEGRPVKAEYVDILVKGVDADIKQQIRYVAWKNGFSAEFPNDPEQVVNQIREKYGDMRLEDLSFDIVSKKEFGIRFTALTETSDGGNDEKKALLKSIEALLKQGVSKDEIVKAIAAFGQIKNSAAAEALWDLAYTAIDEDFRAAALAELVNKGADVPDDILQSMEGAIKDIGDNELPKERDALKQADLRREMEALKDAAAKIRDAKGYSPDQRLPERPADDATAIIEAVNKIANRMKGPDPEGPDGGREEIDAGIKALADKVLVRIAYYVSQGNTEFLEMERVRRMLQDYVSAIIASGTFATSIDKSFSPFRNVMEREALRNNSSTYIDEIMRYFQDSIDFKAKVDATIAANQDAHRVDEDDWTGDSEFHKGSTSLNKGGIDFRVVPMITQPGMGMSVPAVDMKQLQLLAEKSTIKDLDKEWSNIQKQIKGKQMPYAKMKEYVAVCCQQKAQDKHMKDVVACVNNILKLEEKCAVATSPEMKELLVMIEAGRAG